jgi:hypothetical protein
VQLRRVPAAAQRLREEDARDEATALELDALFIRGALELTAEPFKLPMLAHT